ADTIKANKKEIPENNRFAKSVTKQKTEGNYNVLVDTNTVNRTFGLKDTLKIELHQPAKKIDQGKVYLSYDNNGIEVEALYQMKTDSSGIYITSDWQENKIYTLRLIKGWAIDVEDKEFIPNKLSFKTRKIEDYASLIVNIDRSYQSKNYLVEITKDNQIIYLAPLSKLKIELGYLQAGVYHLALIDDEDKNGKWTSGDFVKRKHAEKILHHYAPLA